MSDRTAKKIKARQAAESRIPQPSANGDGQVTEQAKTQSTQSKQSYAETLLGIALSDSELWHTPDGVAYATIQRNGHREHWPLRSKSYRQWLGRQFYDQVESAIGSQTMQDVINTLEGKAMFDGPEYIRYLRVAEHDGRIYIDLADDAWRAIEIDDSDWRVAAEPPVRFCRPDRMLPLPVPERGGKVDELRPFVNLADNGWPIILSFLVAAMRPVGPYPILKTIGEQGSAKTTLVVHFTNNVVVSVFFPSGSGIC